MSAAERNRLTMQRLPLIAPNPPRLADYRDALERIEQSGIYSTSPMRRSG